MITAELLPGLPPYGDPAVACPPEWGSRGREGVVVRFSPATGSAWIGNFSPGLGGLSSVFQHPNGRDILVAAEGNLYSVEPNSRNISQYSGVIFANIEIPNSKDIIFDRQGLAFFRIGAKGIVWHTRRISWDGFRNVKLNGERILGEAMNAPTDEWIQFEVSILTGHTKGGCIPPPGEQWERLAG